MLINSTKEKIAYKNLYGVITLHRVMALFLTTNFNKSVHTANWEYIARPPPHFDLISQKFKSEESRDGF